VSFKEHPDAKTRYESAVRIAKAILDLDLYPPHKREFLSVCIWKITEAHGKYYTRFKSRAALASDRSNLAHEHVYRQKLLINKLLASPQDAESILSKAIGCTVTREEHGKLTVFDQAHPNADGWQRYKEVGIEVIDTLTDNLYQFDND
jgi:hypothetical protein